uniref:Uncharacterized protein n=1 Tax=Kuenenia stuttgartiensis TaxID=174633 RepID=Q1Q462_KUEST|nr:unknown protein [Candidatus Kuenenia stuttgartiensis]
MTGRQDPLTELFTCYGILSTTNRLLLRSLSVIRFFLNQSVTIILNLMTLVCNLNLCVYAYNGVMYCGKIPMPKSQNPCLDSEIYLSFVLLIERLVQVLQT